MISRIHIYNPQLQGPWGVWGVKVFFLFFFVSLVLKPLTAFMVAAFGLWAAKGPHNQQMRAKVINIINWQLAAKFSPHRFTSNTAATATSLHHFRCQWSIVNCQLLDGAMQAWGFSTHEELLEDPAAHLQIIVWHVSCMSLSVQSIANCPIVCLFCTPS